MKINKKTFIISMILISFILISSCKKSNIQKNKTEKAIAFNVKTQIAKISKITEYFDYAGTVKSYNTTVVLPEVAGRIKKLYKEIGDFVRKGDLLFELEDTVYKAQYEQAKAGFESAKINLKDAAKNRKRIEAVYNKKGVSKAQLEKAVSGYELALNNFKRAKAALAMAEFQYKSTKVRAPFSGIITGKYKEEGDFINPSMGGFSPTTGVYTLEDYGKIYVDTDIPSSEAYLIKAGQFTEIISNGEILNAKVLTVNEKTDPMSSSVSVRIIAQNRDKKILPGTIVNVRIHYKEKSSALVVPASAIIDGEKAFVMKNGKAEERKVTIGFKNPKTVEVLLGINEGEKVIYEGNFGLFNGAFVKEEQR